MFIINNRNARYVHTNKNKTQDFEVRHPCCVLNHSAQSECETLCIEVQRMWNMKCMSIPVIIGATGIVTRSLRKNLEAVPEKHSIDSLQKAAILVTTHIIRKVLQYEA